MRAPGERASPGEQRRRVPPSSAPPSSASPGIGSRSWVNLPEPNEPIRVELIDDAVADLVQYAATGNLPLFLKKLIRLEEVGKEAGLPLGRGLIGWRKIVVGDRDRRIVFAVNREGTVATVWVVGDRDDAACYEEAERRVRNLGADQPHAASLAAVMFQMSQQRRATKRRR